MKVHDNGMVIDTNTDKDSLLYRPRYARFDIKLYEMIDTIIQRTPSFERFISEAAGEYYIEAKPDTLVFSHAEFSDHDTASRFNALVGGRFDRQGNAVLRIAEAP